MNDEAIQAQVDEWFEKADANNDGKLSLAEASEYICVWIMTEYAIEGEQDKIAEIFDQIDTAGDNFISKQELFNHIKSGQDVFYDAEEELPEVRDGTWYSVAQQKVKEEPPRDSNLLFESEFK